MNGPGGGQPNGPLVSKEGQRRLRKKRELQCALISEKKLKRIF